jgi:hypothetical protein
VLKFVSEALRAGVCSSGGSEDGGSSPMLGFKGVRNGDLNGFWSVLVASFSRRRFACGVAIFVTVDALVPAVLDVAGWWVGETRPPMSSVASQTG